MKRNELKEMVYNHNEQIDVHQARTFLFLLVYDSSKKGITMSAQSHSQPQLGNTIALPHDPACFCFKTRTSCAQGNKDAQSGAFLNCVERRRN